MDDYVSKPVDPDDLAAAIDRCLTGVTTDRGAAAATESGGLSPAGTGLQASTPSGPTLPGVGAVAAQRRNTIDMDQALRRVGGDEQVLHEILTDFGPEFDDAVSQIREACAQSDQELAHRLAHTLKGAAGNISAHALHASATELDDAIKSSATIDDLEPLLQTAGTALKDVFAAIADVSSQSDIGSLPAGDPVGGAAPVTPDEFTAALADLERLIQDSDPVGVEAPIDVLRRYPDSPNLGDYLQRLQSQIADFDFDAAGDTLASISGQLETDPV